MSKSRLGLTDSFANVSNKVVLPQSFFVMGAGNYRNNSIPYVGSQSPDQAPHLAATSSTPSAGVKRKLEETDRTENTRPAKKARLETQSATSADKEAAHTLVSLFTPRHGSLPRPSSICSSDKIIITIRLGLK